jgi:hypothetical protein
VSSEGGVIPGFHRISAKYVSWKKHDKRFAKIFSITIAVKE